MAHYPRFGTVWYGLTIMYGLTSYTTVYGRCTPSVPAPVQCTEGARLLVYGRYVRRVVRQVYGMTVPRGGTVGQGCPSTLANT